MKVFSAFGGIECGRVALDQLGITPEMYVSSEIKPHALAIVRYNYPDVIHVGDITKVSGYEYRGFDLLMGGSPCQDLSVGSANGEGLAGLKSGLFYHFIRLLGEMRPKYFLLENVVPKKKEWTAEITRIMGVEPILIDSALVSAQSRKRYYWSNIPGIGQPKDMGMTLKDILEKDVDPKYILTDKAIEYMNRKVSDGRTHRDFSLHGDSNKEKSQAVVRNSRKGIPYNVVIERDFIPYDPPRKKNGIECLGVIPESIKPKGNYLPRERVFSDEGKSRAISRHVGQYPFYKTEDIIRRFTPTEVERLQTLPENYTKFGEYNGKVKQVPDTARYDCVGDGWTVNVIIHILSYVPWNQ